MPSFRDSSFAFLQGASYSTTATITGTSDPTVYQSEHYNAGNLIYQTSVPNGTYTVKLRLAELYWTSPEQRVFNVQLNGTQVGTNLDILAAARWAAYVGVDLPELWLWAAQLLLSMICNDIGPSGER
jgi:hypothetical protein